MDDGSTEIDCYSCFADDDVVREVGNICYVPFL